MQQIADWLEKLGLGQYAQRFAENDIDFDILSDLTDQDLEKIGHRTRWLSCVATWSGDGSSGIRSGRLRRHACSGSITPLMMDRTLWCACWRA